MYLKQITLSKSNKILRDNPVRRKEYKRITGNIHRTKQKQIARHDWTKFVNLKWKYVQLLMIWKYFFFTEKLAVQIGRLHDLSAVRGLET